MELWIRSQDKEKLIKVTQLIIKEDVCIENKKGHAIASIEFKNTYGYNFLYLGIYSTKERALEILDEIQSILKPMFVLDSKSIKSNGNFYEENGMILQNYSGNYEVRQFGTYVYEMPKE